MDGQGVEVDTAARIGAGKHAAHRDKIFPQTFPAIDNPHTHHYPECGSYGSQQKKCDERFARFQDIAQVHL